MKDVLCGFNLTKNSSSTKGVNLYIKAYSDVSLEWVNMFKLICIYMITP